MRESGKIGATIDVFQKSQKQWLVSNDFKLGMYYTHILVKVPEKHRRIADFVPTR